MRDRSDTTCVKTVARLDETRETFAEIDAISAEMNANDGRTFAIIAKTKKMAHQEESCVKIDAKDGLIYAIFEERDTSRLSSVSRELRKRRY